MAVVVVSAAALLVRSVINLNRVDAGFDPRGTVTFSVALPPNAYPAAEGVERFSQIVSDHLRRIPSVTDVAAGSSLPMGPWPGCAMASMI